MWVVLTPHQIALADEIARRRRENARRRNWVERNGADMYDGDKLDLLGARGEMAGFIALRPVVWHYFKEFVNRDIPDYNTDLDIKTRPKAWHDLPVGKTGHLDWKYILACGEQHPAYEIVGWAYGHEIMIETQRKPMGGFPAYCKSRGTLRPLEDLLPIMGPRR